MHKLIIYSGMRNECRIFQTMYNGNFDFSFETHLSDRNLQITFRQFGYITYTWTPKKWHDLYRSHPIECEIAECFLNLVYLLCVLMYVLEMTKTIGFVTKLSKSRACISVVLRNTISNQVWTVYDIIVGSEDPFNMTHLSKLLLDYLLGMNYASQINGWQIWK
jgi:hypothetical protein